MKVVVNYTVPVLVAVDTEAGKVEWVTVIDEAAELNRDGAHADGKVITRRDNGDDVRDQPTRDLALEIVGAMPWPVWDIGG